MATLNATVKLSLEGQYDAGDTTSSLVSAVKSGQNGFPTTDLGLTYGSGNVLSSSKLQANDWVVKKLTIAAGATTSIDLTGSSTYANPFGTANAFTSVRGVVVAVVSPDGAKKVVVGPQNVTNAAQLWFAGVGADAGEDVYWQTVKLGPVAGWAVAAGTGDLLPIKNPGVSPVDVVIWIAGVK